LSAVVIDFFVEERRRRKRKFQANVSVKKVMLEALNQDK